MKIVIAGAGIGGLTAAMCLKRAGCDDVEVFESNRRKGIDIMLDLVEQRAPQGFADRESVLLASELEMIVADYKKLASQDRETLLRLANAQ